MSASRFILILLWFLHPLTMHHCQETDTDTDTDTGTFWIKDLTSDGRLYVRDVNWTISFTMSQNCGIVLVTLDGGNVLCNVINKRGSWSTQGNCRYDKVKQVFRTSSFFGKRKWEMVNLQAEQCDDSRKVFPLRFNVTVMEAPQILSFTVTIKGDVFASDGDDDDQDDVAVDAGSTVSIGCRWNSGTPPQNASLTRNGVVLSPSRFQTLPPDDAREGVSSNRVEHTIAGFTAQDEGMYACELGDVEKTVWIRGTGDHSQSTPITVVVGLSVGVSAALFFIIVVPLVVCLWRRHWVLPCARTSRYQVKESTRHREQTDDTPPTVASMPNVYELRDLPSPPDVIENQPGYEYRPLQTSDTGNYSDYSEGWDATATAAAAAASTVDEYTGPYNELKPIDIGLKSVYSPLSGTAQPSGTGDDGYEISIERSEHSTVERNDRKDENIDPCLFRKEAACIGGAQETSLAHSDAVATRYGGTDDDGYEIPVADLNAAL
ncbi:uncharacterized protein LOC143286438 [Babylonia areolata]|uniref:uncharacterized protein LOC143286438 n=1 Tax=Babylonia areolata TaxID=304850 RepID=UPI003FD354EA